MALSFNIIAVLTIVEQAHAVACFRKVCPFVTADLKARPVPAVVPVGRPFHMPKLDIIGRLSGTDICIESRLQQAVGIRANPRGS